VCVF
jgi:serine/threonine-protein phosphatase 2A catalytic subunit